MNLLHISQTIKKIRIKRGMSVTQLAEKSGFSKAFISRLENFRVNASVAALAKITDALGITMSNLFQEDVESPQYLFGTLDDGEPLDRDDGAKHGINYRALFFRKLDKRLDPFVVAYTPAPGQREFLTHEQDEFFLLLEGTLDFAVGDDGNTRRMKAGDTLYLSKNVPHRISLPDAKDAKALVIFTQPPGEEEE